MLNTNIDPKDMREKIKELVENGSYSVRKNENSTSFENHFYNKYETVLHELELGALPIEFDKVKGQFRFLASFEKDVDKFEFLKWKQMFVSRYNDIYREDGEEKDYSEIIETVDEEQEWGNEDDEVSFPTADEIDAEYVSEQPDLSYRASSIQYAKDSVKLIMDYLTEDRLPDSYGWIENRKQQFFLELGSECDAYLLSRLPVSFSPSLSFDCPAKELEVFFQLYYKRKFAFESAMLDARELKLNLEKTKIPKQKTLNSKKEMQALINEMHINQSNEIALNHAVKWKEENKKYHFTSAVSAYPGEVTKSFVDSNDLMAKIENNQPILAKDFDVKPIAKIPPEQFNWN